MEKLTTTEQVSRFLNAVNAKGFKIDRITDSVITIIQNFTPGDSDAFADADMNAYSILSLAPLKGGSIWGTDGGSIGGAIGLEQGYYRLNKSGTGARFIAALRKEIKK